jgi:hypothetical protein
LDEQYLACFIECVICGTVDPGKLKRPSVERIMTQNPSLRDRIAASRESNTSEERIWIPENERVRSVLLKLSRGHIAYELYPYLEESLQIRFIPIANLNVDARAEFETLTHGHLQSWSEIGTRAFHRESGKSPDGYKLDGDWVIIQPGRYRYAVSEAHGPLVRMVLSEYLACEVRWEC